MKRLKTEYTYGPVYGKSFTEKSWKIIMNTLGNAKGVADICSRQYKTRSKGDVNRIGKEMRRRLYLAGVKASKDQAVEAFLCYEHHMIDMLDICPGDGYTRASSLMTRCDD